MAEFHDRLRLSRVGNNVVGINSEMPFVIKGGDGVESYWNVHPTGDWGEDNKTGRAYAKALLKVVKKFDRMALALRVIGAMNLAHPNGIEIGFLTEMVEMATKTVTVT